MDYKRLTSQIVQYTSQLISCETCKHRMRIFQQACCLIIFLHLKQNFQHLKNSSYASAAFATNIDKRKTDEPMRPLSYHDATMLVKSPPAWELRSSNSQKKKWLTWIQKVTLHYCTEKVTIYPRIGILFWFFWIQFCWTCTKKKISNHLVPAKISHLLHSVQRLKRSIH